MWNQLIGTHPFTHLDWLMTLPEMKGEEIREKHDVFSVVDEWMKNDDTVGWKERGEAKECNIEKSFWL